MSIIFLQLGWASYFLMYMEGKRVWTQYNRNSVLCTTNSHSRKHFPGKLSSLEFGNSMQQREAEDTWHDVISLKVL
jgi:hypothetical protein